MKSKTKKNKLSPENIIVFFLNMLNTVKLYHWKTKSFAQHKSTDQLYSELNENIDKFVEVLLGITQKRANLLNTKYIPLNDYPSLFLFKKKIDSYIYFLKQMNSISLFHNTDLLNIRDEILGNLNQFKYLLTFY
uniref:Uncharacterized protein n=1 Tax=viral metagenome TaxID=1070528 RepID=A0A6C0H6N0_9ZZZZ